MTPGAAYHVDEAQLDVLGQLLEVGAAGTEQDRHLVEDQLVDETGAQCLGHHTAPHQRDVLVAGRVPRGGDRVLDPGR